MANEDISDTDDFPDNPKDAVVMNLIEEGLEDCLEDCLENVLLENKFMDQLNSDAKGVLVGCFNYTLAVGAVIFTGLRCTQDGCNVPYLTSEVNLPIIISFGYGVFIAIITWTHSTYFAKQEGKSNLEDLYDLTDKVIVIDSLLEIPIAFWNAPYVTIALWVIFFIVTACIYVLSLSVDVSWNPRDDPAKFFSDFVAMYHLYKVTGDLSQYYVLNKTTDTSDEALQKVKDYKEKATKRRKAWSPYENRKKSLHHTVRIGGYFISACVIIFFTIATGVFTITTIGLQNGNTTSVFVNDYNSSDAVNITSIGLNITSDDVNDYVLLDVVNLSTLIVTGLSSLSSLLLIKATRDYQHKRESTGIAGFMYTGWIFFLIGAGFQVVLWKWYSISILSSVGETGKAIFNTGCIVNFSIATLCIIIHALASRQI